MTHFPQPHPQRRSPRVHLGGSILALVLLEDAFQTQSGPVHGMAEMLHPTQMASEGVMQPFRFIALGDDDHRALRMVVDSVTDRSFLGIRSSQWLSPKGS